MNAQAWMRLGALLKATYNFDPDVDMIEVRKGMFTVRLPIIPELTWKQAQDPKTMGEWGTMESEDVELTKYAFIDYRTNKAWSAWAGYSKRANTIFFWEEE